MKENRSQSSQTPFLSGGYLNWLVHNQKQNNQRLEINKALYSRPRERQIKRLH